MSEAIQILIIDDDEALRVLRQMKYVNPETPVDGRSVPRMGNYYFFQVKTRLLSKICFDNPFNFYELKKNRTAPP